MTTQPIRRGLLAALLILAGLLFAGLLLVNPGHTAGQSGGNIQLATAVQSLSITMAATPTNKVITSNIGQTAHQLVYTFTTGGTVGCALFFQGSNDNSHWNTLAVGSDQFAQPIAIGSGYFPYLRVLANAVANPSCSGYVITIFYTGSQTALANDNGFFMSFTQNVNVPASHFCLPGGPCSNAYPYVLGGITCYNSSAATAFLQVIDSVSAPSLPSANTVLTAAIPTLQSYTYSGPPLLGSLGLYAAATTTFNGSTGVGTGVLPCHFNVNPSGPFFPLFPTSP